MEVNKRTIIPEQWSAKQELDTSPKEQENQINIPITIPCDPRVTSSKYFYGVLFRSSEAGARPARCAHRIRPINTDSVVCASMLVLEAPSNNLAVPKTKFILPVLTKAPFRA